MTFQYIIHHLDKPHSWFIVLTNPHTELNTKKKLEQQGFITYVPLVSVRRCWERNTHPGDSEMCICICN